MLVPLVVVEVLVVTSHLLIQVDPVDQVVVDLTVHPVEVVLVVMVRQVLDKDILVDKDITKVVFIPLVVVEVVLMVPVKIV